MTLSNEIVAKAVELGINTDIEDRWRRGIPHHPRSEELMEFLSVFDLSYANDIFDWNVGGDGDNGETMMYELDVYFETKDRLGQ